METPEEPWEAEEDLNLRLKNDTNPLINANPRIANAKVWLDNLLEISRLVFIRIISILFYDRRN